MNHVVAIPSAKSDILKWIRCREFGHLDFENTSASGPIAMHQTIQTPLLHNIDFNVHSTYRLAPWETLFLNSHLPLEYNLERVATNTFDESGNSIVSSEWSTSLLHIILWLEVYCL